MIVLGRGTLQERWAVVDGYRIFARVSERMQSAGVPPVVLVHGLGVSSRYMVPLACSLARHFPVYSPDLPGFGEAPDRNACSALRSLVTSS
ncbi:MAG TPA: alpha/beta fold hydrolase [Bryobacteraceae bacterium]|nr:alpha/beta fold hydrolase [Bryobacteraceae bacterium]